MKKSIACALWLGAALLLSGCWENLSEEVVRARDAEPIPGLSGPLVLYAPSLTRIMRRIDYYPVWDGERKAYLVRDEGGELAFVCRPMHLRRDLWLLDLEDARTAMPYELDGLMVVRVEERRVVELEYGRCAATMAGPYGVRIDRSENLGHERITGEGSLVRDFVRAMTRICPSEEDKVFLRPGGDIALACGSDADLR
jgi:hypothetical protein